MSNDKWEQMKNAATDAVSKTISNNFDVIKTAQELNDKYGKDSDNKK
ncbi:hypothetical protein [Paenibacillus sp. 1001270B_150601_E10]|nr:hypothetical protein [Paenibacillus sp. 1001270B_150601_E10]